MEEIEREVTTFIVDNFLFGKRTDAPGPEESFLSSA